MQHRRPDISGVGVQVVTRGPAELVDRVLRLETLDLCQPRIGPLGDFKGGIVPAAAEDTLADFPMRVAARW
jgi:hypothetical protein